MSLLNSISHSKSDAGIRAVIAGVEKIGKTTLACGAPSPLLVPIEMGFSSVDVMKTPTPESFEQLMELVSDIRDSCIAGTFEYKSLIFDSATATERLIHDAVLRRDPLYSPGNKKSVTMDSALGGYGKGFAYANDLFSSFLTACDDLANNAGINIIFTCHVFAGKVMDPAFGEYDSWDILLHSPKNQKTYGKREMITQWADIVGFLHEPIFVTEGKISKGVNLGKGRILAVTRAPSYVAGNRFGIVEDIAIPKDGGWNHLAQGIYDSSGIDVFSRDGD